MIKKDKIHDEIMNQVFDLVKLVADYAEETEQIENIFVCGSHESGITTADAFCTAHKKIVSLNAIKGKSEEEADEVLDDVLMGMWNIFQFFDEFEQEKPTQIRIKYSFEEEKVDCKYNYEPYWSGKEDSTKDVFEEWREIIAQELIN